MKIAPVVDIFPQLCYSKHDYKRISEEMELLASLGFKRVYFVVSIEGYPMFSNPWLSINEHEYNHALESILSVGDPNFAYMHECHKHGMKAFAIYKPYEGGGGSTIPHGKKMSFDFKYIDSIGGKRVGFSDFIIDNPPFRVKRKNNEEICQATNRMITDIGIKFCIDKFDNKISQKDFFEHSIQNIEVEKIEFDIYVSEDNGKYELLKAKAQFDYEYVCESILDANERLVSDAKLECLSVMMRDINIPKEKKYIAVKVKYDEELFTIPNSMINIYCNGTSLPATYTTHIRQPAEPEKGFENYQWGSEVSPKQYKGISEEADDFFQNMGFEFDWHGSGFWGDGWSSSPYFAVAKGKLKYMKGTLCEAYPEVRKHWLDEIYRLLAMGYDGIDIRLQNHSGMVSDYCSYGYNAPIRNKYLEMYGIDLNISNGDPMKIMKTRGDFFLEFLKDVSKSVHKKGKTLQMHLRNCHENPILSNEFNELGFWAMPKVVIDWKKAIDYCDEVTIKDYFFNDYSSSKCQQIKRYAKSQNKSVWIHCYIAQGNELNKDYIGNVLKDDEIDGILLYEVAHNTRFEINRGLINQEGEVCFNKEAYDSIKEIFGEYKNFDLKGTKAEPNYCGDKNRTC